MIKGRYTTVYISLLLHLLLLVTLFLLSPKQKHQPQPLKKTSSIKSYMYRAVTTNKSNEDDSKVTASPTKLVEPVKSVIKSDIKEDPILAKETPPETVKTPIVDPKTKQQNNPSQIIKTAKKKINPMPVPTNSFSSHKSLANLRNTINQQLANEAFIEQTQVRSASVMHGKQIPVPHSTVPLTVEEKHKKTTSKSHVQSITKNDDGTCTLVREQILGSPVEASVSSFSCGESKFDKSFREHMKKVNAKFIINKK